MEWDDEKPCFRTLAVTLAQFYSLQTPLDAANSTPVGAAVGQGSVPAQQGGIAEAKAATQPGAGVLEASRASPTVSMAGAETCHSAPHSNGSAGPHGHEVGGEEDAVDAALAAQRPHSILSASEPVGDTVVAQAVDTLTVGPLADSGKAQQPEQAMSQQEQGTGQAANVNPDVPMDVAVSPAVKASPAADAATQGGDSLRAAASPYKAEDERAWTIQHVRRRSLLSLSCCWPSACAAAFCRMVQAVWGQCRWHAFACCRYCSRQCACF